jgi:hypothetical protein
VAPYVVTQQLPPLVVGGAIVEPEPAVVVVVDLLVGGEICADALSISSNTFTKRNENKDTIIMINIFVLKTFKFLIIILSS